MIVIAGHGAAGAIADTTRRGTEAIPNRLTATIRMNGAFDLIGRGGTPPAKVRGEVTAFERRQIIGSCVRHVSIAALPTMWKGFQL
jgi:hypothetical protein